MLFSIHIWLMNLVTCPRTLCMSLVAWLIESESA